MNILITNDDGINAEGIKALVRAASEYGDVYVAAPASQQSAKSQSLTFLRPVEITEKNPQFARRAFAVDGTPTDCVKWAVPWFEDKGITFDYLFSGINMGANTGLAAYYSGTISAAREGGLHGIRSIAFSVQSHDASEFDYTLGLLPHVMKMADALDPSTVLSVNAPNLPADEVKGVRIVEAAPWGYGEAYLFRKEEDGLYQMGGVPLGNSDLPLLRYDYDCLHLGYASISPLITHMSDSEACGRLNDLFAAE